MAKEVLSNRDAKVVTYSIIKVQKHELCIQILLRKLTITGKYKLTC